MIRTRFGSNVAGSLARVSAGTFFVRFGYVGLEFLVTIALARLLGVTGYGVYAFAFAVTRLASLPAQAGLPTLAVKESAKYLVAKDEGALRGFIIRSNQLVGVISLVLLACGIPLAWMYFAKQQGTFDLWTFVLALLLVPLVSLGNLRGGILRGLNRVVWGQLPEAIIRPGAFLLLLGIAAVFDVGIDPSTAMGFHLIAATLAFAWGVWALFRVLPQCVRNARPVFRDREWVATLVPLTLFGGFQVLNAQISLVSLGILGSLSEVGIYRVASQFGLFAGFALIVVNIAIAPRIAKAHAESNLAELSMLARAGSRIVFLLTLLIAGLLIPSGDLVLRLGFGDEYAAAYLPFVALCLGHLVASLGGIAMIMLNMAGGESSLAKIVGYTVVGNLVLHVALIPFLGALGAAVASAVATIAANYAAAIATKRRIRVDTYVFADRAEQ